MDFKKATDVLLSRVTHEALANELGVSVPAIRQARLSTSAQAYRTPPRDWERAVKALAQRQITQYQKLIAQLGI
jgi:hypothetical protein